MSTYTMYLNYPTADEVVHGVRDTQANCHAFAFLGVCDVRIYAHRDPAGAALMRAIAEAATAIAEWAQPVPEVPADPDPCQTTMVVAA